MGGGAAHPTNIQIHYSQAPIPVAPQDVVERSGQVAL